MNAHSIYLDDSAATFHCGQQLGRQAQAPLLLGLEGEMGAGKTHWTQGFAAGYGVSEVVTSPTFALMHSYQGRRGPLYHLDLYRLSSFDELLDLGFEEWLQEELVIVMEWSSKFASELKALGLYTLHFEHAPPGRRLLFSEPVPQSWEATLQSWS